MIRKFYIALVRLDRWLRLRFTPVGRLLLSALIAVGLFALNPRATLAYQLALLIFVVLCAAILWAPAFRPALSAQRRMPKFATVGIPLEYTLEIENHKQGGLFDLEAFDEPLRISSEQTMRAALSEVVLVNGGERKRSWVRRGVGYMRFARTLRVLEGVRCESSTISRLPGQGIARVPMRLLPVRRGYLRLARLRVTRADPLGVFRATTLIRLDDQLLVLPKRYRVSWSTAGLSSRNAHQGANLSRTSGQGADFARLREYRPRDPLRHIHWRAWARLGEPVVKEFHDETPSRNALVLDVCAGATVADKTFEEAVSVAASFVTESSWCSGQLDLLVAGELDVSVSRGGDGESTARMLEALACVQARRVDSFPIFGDGLVRRLSRFSACVLVLLDLDPPRLELVRQLQQAQVTTLVLLVTTATSQHIASAVRSLAVPPLLQVVPADQAEHALATLSSLGAASGR